MKYLNRIVVDSAIRFGKPSVRGTRITVGEVLGFLAEGGSETELFDEFPQLTHEDVLACFGFASERAATAGTSGGVVAARLLLDENLSERLLPLLIGRRRTHMRTR